MQRSSRLVGTSPSHHSYNPNNRVIRGRAMTNNSVFTVSLWKIKQYTFVRSVAVVFLIGLLLPGRSFLLENQYGRSFR